MPTLLELRTQEQRNTQQRLQIFSEIVSFRQALIRNADEITEALHTSFFHTQRRNQVFVNRLRVFRVLLRCVVATKDRELLAAQTEADNIQRAIRNKKAGLPGFEG